MTREYLTPYGQEQQDRFRRAWPLAPFGALAAVAVFVAFLVAGLIYPDPPRERNSPQRGYRYRPPGA